MYLSDIQIIFRKLIYLVARLKVHAAHYLTFLINAGGGIKIISTS
jgi:hypothetical protein